MPFVSRSTRHLATVAWPALIAALVMIGFTSSANGCPLSAQRCECGASPSWSTGAEQILNLALARERAGSGTKEVTGAVRATPPLLDAHRPIPRAQPILALAPKTSPPR